MLRITVHNDPATRTFQLEGKLAGPWVQELEHCWHTTIAEHPDKKISVDLSGVTCVDQAGQYLLRLMRRDGVSLIGAGLAIRETLNEMAGNARKGD